MKVYIGADHRGFELKEKLKQWLNENKFQYQDMGAVELDPGDDYPIYAQKVASIVAREPESRGILICGSGVGVEVVANKFDGIRAGIGKEVAQVKAAREDDDMNVLVIASDFTKEDEAHQMVDAFISTPFSGEERHKKRLDQIAILEENN